MSTPISLTPGALDVKGVTESLASLPASFCVGETGGPRVGVVRGPEWMRQARDELARGIDGILAVPSTGPLDQDAVAAILASGRPVVIDDRWSHSSGVDPLTAALGQVPDAGLVEFGAHVPEDEDLSEAFIDLLVLADIVAGPLETIRPASVHRYAINATGTGAESREIFISVRRSGVGTGSAFVRAVGETRATDALLPGSSSAAPTTVRLHVSDAVHHYPTVYESSHRAAWRALAAAVHEQAAVADVSRRSRIMALLDSQPLLGAHQIPTTSSTANASASTAPANQKEKK